MIGKMTGVKCPKCSKKGLGHPPHAHAQGYKEYGEVRCRYCKTRWKTENIKEYIKKEKLANNYA